MEIVSGTGCQGIPTVRSWVGVMSSAEVRFLGQNGVIWDVELWYPFEWVPTGVDKGLSIVNQ